MRTIIITGDHKLTAKSVANKLGLKIEDKNILEASDLEKCQTKNLNLDLEI